MTTTSKLVDAVAKDLQEKGAAHCELFLHTYDGTKNQPWQSFWRSGTAE